MSEENTKSVETVGSDETSGRIYEVGYHIMPTVAESDLEKVVGDIRSIIEKAGGVFIAEGAPVLTRLAYTMDAREGDKWAEQDRAYFGWIKFESSPDTAEILTTALNADKNILRHIVFKTVREDTRAKIKLATVREVRRTDAIKPTTRRADEESAPVSEEDLEKAISDITVE